MCTALSWVPPSTEVGLVGMPDACMSVPAVSAAMHIHESTICDLIVRNGNAPTCTRAIFVAAPWPVLYFQLDRAQSHAAREAQVFLDNKHIQTLTWTCCPESEIIISTYSAARVFLGQHCWALRLDNQTLLPCRCLNLNRLFIICLEM